MAAAITLTQPMARTASEDAAGPREALPRRAGCNGPCANGTPKSAKCQASARRRVPRGACCPHPRQPDPSSALKAKLSTATEAHDHFGPRCQRGTARGLVEQRKAEEGSALAPEGAPGVTAIRSEGQPGTQVADGAEARVFAVAAWPDARCRRQRPPVFAGMGTGNREDAEASRCSGRTRRSAARPRPTRVLAGLRRLFSPTQIRAVGAPQRQAGTPGRPHRLQRRREHAQCPPERPKPRMRTKAESQPRLRRHGIRSHRKA